MEQTSKKPIRSGLPKYQVEMAGVYWVASQLCRHGLVPSILPRNAPRIDVPVTDIEGRLHATLQVKTRSDKQGWMVGWFKPGFDIHAGPRHFYVFVDLSTETISALVVPSRIVKTVCMSEANSWSRKLTRRGTQRKTFPVSVNLNKHTDLEQYRERWDLVGRLKSRLR